MNVVSVKDLSYSYEGAHGKRPVLNSVQLEVAAGEIVILCGPSGSGKTTLLTLIGGLRTASSGSVNVCGMELCCSDKQDLLEARRKIGFIFQASNLLPYLTVKQNVRLALELDEAMSENEIEQRVNEILTAVGLSARINSYPEGLSGGQKQRVAVARALVRRPKLVLADEPTASLDSKSGRDVVTLMHHMAKEQGTAIVLVTHDNRILDVADRIVEMEDGRISQVSAAGSKVELVLSA
jgi:putative ABC transport system ATP-binding protein